MENDAESYTAQIVSSSLSYESPDGTPVGTDSVYLAVVMVVKSGLNRPTRAPGWDQIDVKKPEWGDSTPTLKPVTNYFTTDQVDATGKGHGAGVRPVTGKLEANTPYYATFGVEIGTDTDVKGSQLCGYPDENPRCIPIGTVTPAKS
ncbi:hypothetical protein ACH4TX_12360 [Streptomyces sp. NPDC021098]|uniref:hypothetical protein n=1 Tax=unclassified Streptomyces TaxID=2593676 RepID=UPI0037B8D0C1